MHVTGTHCCKLRKRGGRAEGALLGPGAPGETRPSSPVRARARADRAAITAVPAGRWERQLITRIVSFRKIVLIKLPL